MSIALALDLYSSESTDNLSTLQRSTTEDYALDSFQNVLFSLARFREVTGHFPNRITIVGYAFKQKRFDELHRKALRWPRELRAWRYVGIDMDDEQERKKAVAGEVCLKFYPVSIISDWTLQFANGYKPYVQDLYGCHDSLLVKRQNRNVHRRIHPYFSSCPDISPLLSWCPGEGDKFNGQDKSLGYEFLSSKGFSTVFGGALPWNNLWGPVSIVHNYMHIFNNPDECKSHRTLGICIVFPMLQ